MSKGKPILSVSLLSSGRIETIEKCLESLIPFQNRLPTEIIVVDTDPQQDPEVRNVVEKYADEVIPFTWCEDFSAARNAGLKACRGKWFLYVDDDEWIINAAPIIDWLESEASEAYVSADLAIANYIDPEYKEFAISYVSRLFRIDRDVAFKGMVHEYPDLPNGKIQVFKETIIGHSGYIYQDDTDRESHIGRNVRLLCRQMEQEPSEMRWKQQLINEYEQTGELEKAISLCDEALRMLLMLKNPGDAWIKGYFICERLRLERMFHDDNAERVIYEKIAEERIYGDVCNSFLDAEAARMYFKSGEYDKAGLYAGAYLQRYETVDTDGADTIRQQIAFLEETFQETNRLNTICIQMESDIRQGRWDSFDRYFAEITWEEGSGFDFSWFAENCIVLTTMMDYDDHMDVLYAAFWKSEVIRPYILKILDIAGKTKDKGYWRVVYALVKAVSNEPDAPFDLMLALYEHEGYEENHYAEVFKRMLEYSNVFRFDSSVWRLLFRHVTDMETIIRESSFMKWRRNVDHATEELAPERLTYFLDRLETRVNAKNSHLQYALFRFGIKELCSGGIADYWNLRDRLQRTFEYALGYFGRVFRDIADYENPVILPDEYRLAVQFEKFFLNVGRADFAEGKALADMIGIMPSMDGVLETFRRLTEDEMSRDIRNIDLSVSLLSSGRVDTIEKCLASLEGLKKELSCEIIVVNTDSDHNPLVDGILEKYADRIIPFRWCDDFAKARNTGLQACRGTWFMFIDDDEWLEEVDPIIDFIKNNPGEGECHATMHIRNYISVDCMEYVEEWVTRLARRTNTLEFKGRIHEYFSPLTDNNTYLDAVIFHTGYAYRTPEEKAEHLERNITLLEQMVEDEPFDMRWQYQLLAEYDARGDFDKQKVLCEHALSLLIHEPDSKLVNRFRGMFAAARIRMERRQNHWIEACAQFERFSEGEGYSEMAKAYMQVDGAQSYWNLNRMKESKRCIHQYLELCGLLHSGTTEVREDSFYFLSEILDEDTEAFMKSMLISMDIREDSWDSFLKYYTDIEHSPRRNNVLDALSEQDAGEILRSFVGACITYYRDLGEYPVAEDGSMPKALRLAVSLEKVFEIPAEDYRLILSGLKEVLGIFPVMDGVISSYSHLYAEELKAGQDPLAEMRQLVEGLYERADALMKQGLINEARAIIAQIEAVAPPELRRND